MARIYVAFYHGGELVGDFARVADFDLAGDVDALKEHLKKIWSTDLAGVELRHLIVYGPWATTAEIPEDDGKQDEMRSRRHPQHPRRRQGARLLHRAHHGAPSCGGVRCVGNRDCSLLL